MKRPADFSQWRGLIWIRERVSATLDRMWRPYRTRIFTIPADTQPVATVRCGASDSLWSLAAKYYRGIDRPEQLWWFIAEVNDIVDPTIALDGMDIRIPPLSLLEGTRV